MDGLEFIARIVATGTVNGVGIGAELGEVGRAIGDVLFVDNTPGRRKTVLLRDYGLVEFTFNRTGEGTDTGAWVCCNFSVQVHRLESGDELRAAWREVHGVDLPAQVTWGELRAVVAREYQVPDPVERAQAGARYFRYPASRTTVLVLDDSPESDAGLENRSVFSISVHPE